MPAIDLVQIAADLSNLAAAITDPASGPDAITSALAAVRTLQAMPGGAGPPAPNLDLQAPDAGVPRPPDSLGVGPDATVSPVTLGVSYPPPVAGPAGAPGDVGPIGPPGPIGPGVDPARVSALEAAVADLQDLILVSDIVSATQGGL